MNYRFIFLIPCLIGGITLSSYNQPRADVNDAKVQAAAIFPIFPMTADTLPSEEITLMKKWRLFDNTSLRDGNGIVANVSIAGQPSQLVVVRKPVAQHLSTDTIDIQLSTYKRGGKVLLFKGTAQFPGGDESNFLYRYTRSDSEWKLLTSKVGS